MTGKRIKNLIFIKISKMFKRIVIFLLLLASPVSIRASNQSIDVLKKIGATEGPYQDLGEYGVSVIIGTVIQALLGLIGTIFLVLMLYAGYNWMIARGEEEKVTKAKDTITRAIIGIIIVVGAYVIWAYVFAKLF